MQGLWFTPDERALAALESHWGAFLPPGATLLRCSWLGDAFVATPAGPVYWLNTGTAECTQIAESVAEFEQALAMPSSDSWLLPALLQALRAEGKSAAEGECYTYAILPIFAEGKYEPWNFRPVPAWEHFEVTASLHHQVTDLPDGTRVRVVIK